MSSLDSRRSFFSLAAASAALVACRPEPRIEAESARSSPLPAGSAAPRSKPDSDEAGEEEEVSAVEDLMREHGVIRRVLVLYRETASRLRLNAASVPAATLQRAATLLRTFGEDYHER